jgi:hypothetical protein
VGVLLERIRGIDDDNNDVAVPDSNLERGQRTPIVLDIGLSQYAELRVYRNHVRRSSRIVDTCRTQRSPLCAQLSPNLAVDG